MLILLYKQKLPLFQKCDGIFKDLKVKLSFDL